MDARELIVRHFRQIVVWPLQLMPLRPGQQVQRHWEALRRSARRQSLAAKSSTSSRDPAEFQERHYKEFVTFLPYVQRFLYGSTAGQESVERRVRRACACSAATMSRSVRITFAPGEAPTQFDVAHIDLYFFLDADIAILAFEMHADDIPLDRAQDTLFRFGRAYPAFWERDGHGGNCPHAVEWLAADGEVLAASDFAARAKYLSFVARYRAPCIANHWEYLLRPLVLEYPGQSGPLRYRQLEYYRMPFMSYLALDDPARAHARGLRAHRPRHAAGRAGHAAVFADRRSRTSSASIATTASGAAPASASRATRASSSPGHTFSIVGRHGDYFFSGAVTGLLGQFRHQYFLLFLIAHFHKAALVSMSDELAVAMNRLTVGDTESVKQFKRTIRQMMEVFLRFTHRYWFHEMSNQALARSVFGRLSRYLGTEELYEEVRNEVTDMNKYLDSDSARRQANTILRLTVVTILGLIGTIATGLLGMNIIDEAAPASGACGC